MKVALIVYGSLEVISGGNLYDLQLVRYLRRQGVVVDIISLPKPKYGVALFQNVFSSVIRRLKVTGADIILQDELCHPSLAWLNQRIKRVFNKPIISIVHHLRTQERHQAWLNQSLYHLVEQQYLDTVDGFIFNSKTTQQTVEACSSQPRPSLVAFPAGDRFKQYLPDMTSIEQRAYTAGPLQLLFLGSIIERKGLHVVADALSRLPEAMVHLTIAGNDAADVAYTQRIRRMITDLKITESVSWAGSLVESDVANVLRDHHLLVMPSQYEGFGIAYLEAMGFGLPAIGTTAGAAHEIIKHGTNGFLIEPEDAPALARTLRTLAKNRDWLWGLSSNARKHYDAHPEWAHSMESIRQFIVQQVDATQ